MAETKDQKANREYHETDFQTHDPVTGLKRRSPLPELVEDAVSPLDEDGEPIDVAEAEAPGPARKRAPAKRRR